MSTETISLDVLMRNVDELYELARLTECETVVPISELRQSFERSFERNAPRIGAKLSQAFSRGKIEEAVTSGIILSVAYVGAVGIDFARNKIAKKKAEEALLPLYKEIAVKNQVIISQMLEDRKKMMELIRDERLRNVNNEAEIKKLEKRIEQSEAIISRVAKLQAQK